MALYINGKDKLQDDIDTLEADTTNIQQTLDGNPNMVDIAQCTEGYALDGNGIPTINSFNWITGFIPIENGSSYVCFDMNMKYLYDANKNYIASSSMETSITSFTINNSSAKYIRAFFPRAKTGSVQLEKGIVLSPYNAYKSGLSYQVQQLEETINVDVEFYKYLFTKCMVIGDSLCEGMYYSSGGSVGVTEDPPYFIGKITGWTMTNGGKAGATALSWYTDRLGLYTDDMAASNIYIIWLGTNGGFTDTLTTDTADADWHNWTANNTGSYCKIIEYIKSVNANARIFLCTLYSSSGALATSNSVINQIATKYTLPVIDMNDGTIYGAGAINFHTFADSTVNTVHFNKVGNVYVANKLVSNITSIIDNDKLKYDVLLL